MLRPEPHWSMSVWWLMAGQPTIAASAGGSRGGLRAVVVSVVVPEAAAGCFEV